MSWKSCVALVVVFVLLLTVFSLSAFASSDFSGQPFFTGDSFTLSQGDAIVANAPESGIFMYTVSGSTYIASSVFNSLVRFSVGNSSFQFFTSGSVTGITGIYYALASSFSVLNPVIPSFSSQSEALTSILDYIENGSAVTSSFSYSLPPGNVAYIEMGNTSAIKLSMDFPELSNTFGTPFSKANSAYALVDSLPTVGSSVASGTVIPWVKSGRLNLIGQTSEASFGPVGPIATRYVAVINPSYYDHVLATGTYRQNPPIQIDALNVLSIQVYPLQSAYTFDNDTGQVTTTIAGDAYVGDVDADTGDIYWTDPDGGSSAPDLGGNNLPEAGNSIFDTLRNIASDFSEFLKGPVSAVRVVVSSIREFMSSFTQLYTWLPSPVYNLITSALMIAITIGVIKIFV